MLTEFLIVFVIVLVAAFFAGIEASFFSIDKVKVRKLSSTGDKKYKLIEFFLNNPKDLVITFLIGNELANITATSLITATVINYLGKEYIALAVVVSSLLLLSLGDITPKIIGSYYPDRYANLVVKPFYTFYLLITPFRYFFLVATQYILKKFGIEIVSEKHVTTKEDLQSIIYTSTEQGHLKEEEKSLIDNTFLLTQTTVVEIMIPRRDIFAVPRDISVGEFVQIIKNKDYSRVVVYEDNLDNIIGIVYLKDVLFLKLEGRDENISKFAKPVIFFPEFTTIIDAMRKFNEEKKHFAIVVDEHGTTVGLITYNDIIEYIVGDIPEEYEPDEPDFKKMGADNWIVSGKLNVEFLSEIGITLPEDYDYDTVAGFILDVLKRFPKEGEEFKYQNYLFKIAFMEKNRIVKVQISKLQDQGEVN
ncbi:MAG: hemolysin family protein [Hydrogenothermaceae bacterium]|nr:hemolysin family protein [Hydrogenothermaceae bacterium]